MVKVIFVQNYVLFLCKDLLFIYYLFHLLSSFILTYTLTHILVIQFCKLSIKRNINFLLK